MLYVSTHADHSLVMNYAVARAFKFSLLMCDGTVCGPQLQPVLRHKTVLHSFGKRALLNRFFAQRKPNCSVRLRLHGYFKLQSHPQASSVKVG